MSRKMGIEGIDKGGWNGMATRIVLTGCVTANEEEGHVHRFEGKAEARRTFDSCTKVRGHLSAVQRHGGQTQTQGGIEANKMVHHGMAGFREHGVDGKRFGCMAFRSWRQNRRSRMSSTVNHHRGYMKTLRCGR